MFIDSHAHIDGPEFDADREDVIQRARDAGVSLILNIGTGDPQSGTLERAVELAEKHDDIFTAVGTHPHDAGLFDDSAAERITNLTKQSSRVIAWGEIGLDFHYDNSPRDTADGCLPAATATGGKRRPARDCAYAGSRR